MFYRLSGEVSGRSKVRSLVSAPLRSVLNGGPLDLQHPFFNVGDEFILKRTPQQDDFYHLMNGKFCGEAWDAISRYVYTALQGGSIMKGWTNDDRMMIACCNDGTRSVIFKIERIDIPENDEEREWLAKQNFRNTRRMPIRAKLHIGI